MSTDQSADRSTNQSTDKSTDKFADAFNSDTASLTPDPPEAWNVVFDGYDPEDEGHREALCALGNGCFVTRGAAIDATADDIHYPGTYRAGLYDRATTVIEGESSDDTTIPNLPNWLPLTFRINGREWFSIDRVNILSYRQTLDLKSAILHREVQFQDAQGQQTTLREQRFVSMAQPHLAAIQLAITAENWSGELEIRSAIDGRVNNTNVKRYKPFNPQHLEPIDTGTAEPEGVWLTVRTQQSRIEISLAARTRVTIADQSVDAVQTVDREDQYIAERLKFPVETGAIVQVEKIVAIYTSRDFAISESATAAQEAVLEAPDFAQLRAEHQSLWKRLWLRCDVGIEPIENLRGLRLNIFHTLQTISPHTADLDAGVPARGWHGEDYRGHIFWDETFVLPFLVCRFPEIARSMLLYRYRRLRAAKMLARQQGYQGAMYPWRSAGTGREETPRFQFNLQSERWMRDHTNLQRHVNAIIACNLWRYYNFTNDLSFIEDYGAEMMVEIARFWASIATHNPDLDRYEIHRVVGPDEYHTAYPDADQPGINNNTYTNVMAAWTLSRTREMLDLLPPSIQAEIRDRLHLSQEELEHWDTISRKMQVVFHADGILSQYEGFDALKPFDAQAFEDESVNLILEEKGDDVNHYRVSKQADTAMLFFLLPEHELLPLMERLGYPFDRTQTKKTIDYHLQHTVHESSLSRLVYAGALAQCDPEQSWHFFKETLFADLSGGSSGEAKNGIHLGAMAGTVHLLQHQYLGLRIHDHRICFDPSLPKALCQFRMTFEFRDNDLEIEVVNCQLKITASSSNLSPIKVDCKGDIQTVQPGKTVTFALSDRDTIG
ncbi:glycoside hydrolase family 65 protein [Leptolyngbya ohadii]|uniref:glycoside hydrolase family 65 protein n=1 Tax=Leptolyngbya ohadii TaxID=1962290 RepID=UPI000B59F2D3|nr:glycosyl hydrolase family 65 protein [Leptolyngbya ohadii]